MLKQNKNRLWKNVVNDIFNDMVLKIIRPVAVIIIA